MHRHDVVEVFIFCLHRWRVNECALHLIAFCMLCAFWYFLQCRFKSMNNSALRRWPIHGFEKIQLGLAQNQKMENGTNSFLFRCCVSTRAYAEIGNGASRATNWWWSRRSHRLQPTWLSKKYGQSAAEWGSRQLRTRGTSARRIVEWRRSVVQSDAL